MYEFQIVTLLAYQVDIEIKKIVVLAKFSFFQGVVLYQTSGLK